MSTELAEVRPISPSQISTALDCLRKWGLESLDGRKGSDKPSTILGQQTHLQAERWLLEGKYPDIKSLPGQVFESGLHHWPAPGSRQFIVEGDFKFTADGINFHGRLDIAYADDDAWLTIGDHKTTSDFRWAKSEEALRKDPQVLLYGTALMARYSQPRAHFQWVYYRTRGAKKSQAVRFDMTWEQVTQGLAEHVMPIARLLWKAKKSGARGLDMPQNPDSCEKFGGCAFRGECNLSPLDVLRSKMSSGFSLEAAFQQGQQGQQAHQQAANQVQATNPQGNDPGAQGMNPPQRQVPGSVLNALQAPQQTGGFNMGGAPQSQWSGLPPAAPQNQQPAQGFQAPPQQQGFQAPPQGQPMQGFPGMPPGSPMPQQPAQGMQAPQQSFQASPQGQPMQGMQAPQQQAAPVKRYTLCVDCKPEGQYNRVSDLVREVNEAVSKSQNVPDYRCVEYGKGPGYLFAAMEDYLNHINIEGVWYLDTSNPPEALVKALFERMTASRFYGVR